MKAIKILILLTMITLMSVFVSAGNWTEQNNTEFITATSTPFDVSITENGSTIILGHMDDYLIKSNDGGINWELENVSTGITAYSTDINSDGTNILVGTYSGKIYISNNSGDSYTELTNTTIGTWSPVAFSEDGSIIIGSVDSSITYRSDDNGLNFTDQILALNSFDFNNDGSVILGSVVGGHLWKASINASAGWTELTNSDILTWNYVAIAKDTNKMFAVNILNSETGLGNLYYSSDNGTTWNNNSETTDNFISLKVSDDGNCVIMSGLGSDFGGGYVYVSNNSGLNFSRQDDLGIGNFGVAVSGDCTKFVVAKLDTTSGYVSNIYTFDYNGTLPNEEPTPIIPSVTPDYQETVNNFNNFIIGLFGLIIIIGITFFVIKKVRGK